MDRFLQTGRPVEEDHRKNLALEGLRGLACLNVVLSHYMVTFMPYSAHFLYPEGNSIQRYGIEYWLAEPFLSVFYNGTYPVAIFFVMSGWVLTAPLVRAAGNPSRAALKRYPRLAIPAAVAILFAWLLFKMGLMGTQRASEVGFAGWLRDDYVHNAALVPDLLLNMLWGAPVNGRSIVTYLLRPLAPPFPAASRDPAPTLASSLLSPYLAQGPGGTSRNSTNFQSQTSRSLRPR